VSWNSQPFWLVMSWVRLGLWELLACQLFLNVLAKFLLDHHWYDNYLYLWEYSFFHFDGISGSAWIYLQVFDSTVLKHPLRHRRVNMFEWCWILQVDEARCSSRGALTRASKCQNTDACTVIFLYLP
jgi:hypothetical protein